MDHRFDNKTPSTQKNFVFYDETVDSRLKFTKIDYARLMQGNYGIGEYISKYVKRIILTLEDGSQKKFSQKPIKTAMVLST